MPTPPKAVDNMTKNLTAEERALREQAERGVIPPLAGTGRKCWRGCRVWSSWMTWTATPWVSTA